MKTLSCGVIVLNEFDQILIGHATGQTHWDLPKGTIEDNELPIECALRETYEEFNLSIPKESLIDLGEKHYNASKNLHLYLWNVKKADIYLEQCDCKSLFNYNGYMIPEIDNYKWIDISEIETHMAKSMVKVLQDMFAVE